MSVLSVSPNSPRARAQTAQLNGDLHSKVLLSNVYELFDKPTHNQTGLQLLHDEVRLFRENTTKAVTNIEMVLHLMRSADQDDSLKLLLEVSVAQRLQQPVHRCMHAGENHV